MDRWSRVVLMRTGNCGHPQTAAKFLIGSQSPRRTRALCRFDTHACCTLLIGKGAMTLDAVKNRDETARNERD